MSGIYVDDEDMGEAFWYTGEGGIDKASNKQVRGGRGSPGGGSLWSGAKRGVRCEGMP